MKYTVRRFSYQESLKNGSEYISIQVDSGLGRIEDLSTKITEDPRFRDLRPVKRHGRLVRNITRLLRRKKKNKDYSESDPTSTINTSEANKFKTALGRLTNSMGSDSQSLTD